MKTLIPLSDFVLERRFEKILDFKTIIVNYAKFLKQPLKLSMFVPIDLKGEILQKPEWKNNTGGTIGFWYSNWFYENAKEKVLFANAVTIDESPYKMTERLMIDLNHPASFRIYNKFTFNDGRVESQFLPNFSKNPTVEYLVDYGLELTPSALEAIGIK